jgi:NitT/TauT family transport system permease protein
MKYFLNRTNNLYVNIIVMLVVLFIALCLIIGIKNIFGPLDDQAQTINLSFKSLPLYAYRTAIRMLLALFATVIIGYIYASLAAKNKRIGAFLIPLLDIFQSVPVLGYLSFTVTAFVAMAPGNILGVELAIIFALLTAQIWNVILSIYQSLTTVPKDLYEVAKIYKLNKWQIFWQIEFPFTIPGLIWNLILSMSSSWFFIVASEAISVGKQTYTLPGLGVYISIALKNADIKATLAAMLAILIVINILSLLQKDFLFA